MWCTFYFSKLNSPAYVLTNVLSLAVLTARRQRWTLQSQHRPHACKTVKYLPPGPAQKKYWSCFWALSSFTPVPRVLSATCSPWQFGPLWQGQIVHSCGGTSRFTFRAPGPTLHWAAVPARMLTDSTSSVQPKINSAPSSHQILISSFLGKCNHYSPVFLNKEQEDLCWLLPTSCSHRYHLKS